MGLHPAKRGGEHGVRGRAGEHETASSATRPADATCYIEITRDVCGYREIAPLFSKRVDDLEERVGVALEAVRELRHESGAQSFETMPSTLAEMGAGLGATEFAAADVRVRAEVKVVWAVDASHLKSQI